MYLSTRSPPALTSWLELSRANWTLRKERDGRGGIGGEGRGGEVGGKEGEGWEGRWEWQERDSWGESHSQRQLLANMHH